MDPKTLSKDPLGIHRPNVKNLWSKVKHHLGFQDLLFYRIVPGAIHPGRHKAPSKLSAAGGTRLGKESSFRLNKTNPFKAHFCFLENNRIFHTWLSQTYRSKSVFTECFTGFGQAKLAYGGLVVRLESIFTTAPSTSKNYA